jgi:hypothetical protein
MDRACHIIVRVPDPKFFDCGGQAELPPQGAAGDRTPAWNKTAREKVLPAGNLTVQS